MDWLLLAGLGLLVFMMAGPILIIPLHIPINYNEGWNAIFDARAVTPGGPPLYPPPGTFVFNNYPPLGFYIVGALGRFVLGDMIMAGRIVSVAALLSAAGFIALCVRGLGGTWRGAAAGGLLLLLYVSAFYRTYVAMDDPQWLAQAIMLGGFAVLLRHGGMSRLCAGQVPFVNLLLAAALMVTGGFVKHNLMALPLSVTLWLFWLNRRAAAVWVAASGALLAACAALAFSLHGQAMLADVLHHRRVFRAKLMTHSFSRLAPMVPMAAAAIALHRKSRRDGTPARPASVFAMLFLLVATITGIFQRLGEGVYYNAHFETLEAACLAFGLGLPTVATHVTWRRVKTGPASLALIAALPLILGWPWHLPIAWRDIAERSERERLWRPVIARIAAADGPAGCILMSLCWWAGKPSQVDVFNLTESMGKGGPIAPFQTVVRNHGIAIFEDDPTSFTHKDGIRQMGHDPIMEALANANYAPILQGPDHSTLLAPHPPGSARQH